MSCSIKRIASLGSRLFRNLAISVDSPEERPAAGSSSKKDFRIAGEAKHDFKLALLAVRQIANFGVLAVEEAASSSRRCAFS